ncbi:MAG TPA: aldehyde dehydrogenase family protein, partial [Kofleriaceae bacterium]|nr:aldehyde dehydrogenase family protein [Kofleriaceae bacterium]
MWSAKPALVLGDDDQPATRLEVDLAMPLTGQRFVTARGRKLTLPSGLITMLPPNTTAAGGVVMADGKTAVLVIAHGSGRELIVVSLGTGQIGQRYALPSTSVRIANDRGVVAAQLDPRTLRILDLRAGRDLGVIAFDRDLADHALDPQARRLAVRDTVGDVELVELAEILRTTTGSLAPSVVHQVRTASGRETASPRCVPHKLALAARGRYTHGSFALPCDVCDEVELRSPMTRDVLGVFPCGAGDVDDAVASASLAHGHWTRMTLDARLAVLARIEAGLAQRGGELMSAMQCELGRPAWECRREVEGLVPRLRDLSTQAGQQLGDVGCGAARILRRAHGVVGVVSPVMLPLATAHGHVMSALIAGNTVVWKPSSLTAGSAQLYVEILSAAGLPAGIINLVQGRAAVGRRLLSHAGIDA